MVRRFRRGARGDIDTRTAIVLILIVIGGIAYFQFAPPGWLLSPKPRPIPPEGIPGTTGHSAQPGSGAATQADARNPPLYKWKDASGQWHITDKPPKDFAFEKVVVDPNANVVPTIVPEVPGREEKKDEDKK